MTRAELARLLDHSVLKPEATLDDVRAGIEVVRTWRIGCYCVQPCRVRIAAEGLAGTGAVGLEAISRGARAALFVEQGVEGRGLIHTNIEAFGLQGRAKIFRRDATALGTVGTMEPFDLLFADPPYGRGLGEKAMAAAAMGGWLVPGALAILEERADVAPAPIAGYEFLEERTFGDTRMHFYRYAPA